ncbi:MAG TPA: DUF5808 domain-containing protein [Gaiellaceae bacterium]|nr:DUF5808 domain-containing protein [Gaiellaceae bacterium]
MRRVRRLVRVLGIALLGAALVTELRKPSAERTWHGRLGGFVPYDLRPPTLDRLRAAWWNPDEPRIFTDRVFGVGWAVNVGRLVRLARGGRG